MKRKDSFILYADQLDEIELLSFEQRGRLLTCIYEFARNEEEIQIDDPAVLMAYRFITKQIKRDTDKYDKICDINRRNAAKRWGKCEGNDSDAVASVGIGSDATLCLHDTDTDTEPESDTESEHEPESEHEGEGEPEVGGAPRGRYANVLISDADMAELADEFPDLDARIERLSEYMAIKGVTYRNHAAVIRSWAKTDHAGRYKTTPSPTPKNKSKEEDEDAYWNEFFEAALGRTERYFNANRTAESGGSPSAKAIDSG